MDLQLLKLRQPNPKLLTWLQPQVQTAIYRNYMTVDTSFLIGHFQIIVELVVKKHNFRKNGCFWLITLFNWLHVAIAFEHVDPTNLFVSKLGDSSKIVQ
jgi:hypothetical protein